MKKTSISPKEVSFQKKNIFVNKNLAIPGVTCQTLGLKIPGSDYTGDADHSVSGKPCVQWNLAEHIDFDQLWRRWTHKKCRNSGADGKGYRAPDGAFCFIKDENGYLTTEGCHQIPGNFFVPILIIKLD